MAVPGTPPSDLEVEWQFDALDLRPVERWLAAHAARPLPARRLVDTYFDTADWRMARAGFVVRVRRRAGGGEVTLKDTNPATNGLRRRLEVTEPLPAAGITAVGPEGPVGRRLRALVGSRPLHEVLEVRTRRRPFTLDVAGAEVAELALDDTTVVAVPDHASPVRLRRVEVELSNGNVSDVEPLVNRLRVECGLQPAALSKFQAGVLAAGISIPALTDLGPTELPERPSVGELAMVALRHNLALMLAHETGTRLGEDPEELHDMRVATRRMRAALALFADALPVRARHVRQELGWLADVLGAVRDLDVQIGRVGDWAAEVPESDRDALGDLRRLLSHHRHDARRRLLAALDSARYDRLVNGFVAMVRQGPPRRSPAARAPALAVVPDLLRMRHDAVTKAARRARRSGAAEDFHRLRIRCKRLRYTMEFVSELYPGQMKKYLRRLVRLQDTLGLMQDARVADERLRHLVVDEGGSLSSLTVFVMGGVAARYRHEGDRLIRKVPKRMQALRGRMWAQLSSHLEHRRLHEVPAYGWHAAAPSTPPSPAPPAQVSATTPPAAAYGTRTPPSSVAGTTPESDSAEGDEPPAW